MRSQSRIGSTSYLTRGEKVRLQDLLGQAPEIKITNRDWSFGRIVRQTGTDRFPGSSESAEG
jgi:hypothetical protein